jgi:hypothetical protein
MKTREELENLKTDWRKDPFWDIEDTEGFEEYREELIEYHKQCSAEWENKNHERALKERKTRPAFPSVKAKYGYEGDYQGLEEDEPGMSIRDYFAGQALAGLCANTSLDVIKEKAKAFAIHSYVFADAMLEEREKE